MIVHAETYEKLVASLKAYPNVIAATERIAETGELMTVSKCGLKDDEPLYRVRIKAARTPWSPR